MPDFLEEGEDWPRAGVFQMSDGRFLEMMDERLCSGSRKKTEEHGLKNELRRTEEEKLKLEFELASQDLRIEELQKEVNDLRIELEKMSKKFMHAVTVAITLAAVHVCLLKPTLQCQRGSQCGGQPSQNRPDQAETGPGGSGVWF